MKQQTTPVDITILILVVMLAADAIATIIKDNRATHLEEEERALIAACQKAWQDGVYKPTAGEIATWLQTIKCHDRAVGDPLHYFAMIDLETLGNPAARPKVDKGETRGLCGFHSATAIYVCDRNNIKRPPNIERALYNPHFSIKLLVAYYEQLLIKYKGSHTKACWAFNSGETSVDRALKAKKRTNTKYYKRLQERKKKLEKLKDEHRKE